ncbi:MAG: serine/threonine-protein kinase [Myxococcota bacterium]
MVNEAFGKRFEREARVMAALSHPNLLRLLALEHDILQPFLVMPFIEGKSLKDALAEKQRFTAREALPILEQLCAGLAYLHSRGVVHRDIKPAKLVLSPDGHVTLLDFGLSRKGGPTDLTSPGSVLGTVTYLAPEVALGEELTFRADLYSLGLVAYHLLTGVTPFGMQDGHATILRHLYETPELASQKSPAVSEAVAEVLAKALAKDPLQRHASAREFFEAFSKAFEVDATAGSSTDASTLDGRARGQQETREARGGDDTKPARAPDPDPLTQRTARERPSRPSR